MAKKSNPATNPGEIPIPVPNPEIAPLKEPANPSIPAEEPEIIPDKEPAIPREIPPLHPGD